MLSFTVGDLQIHGDGITGMFLQPPIKGLDSADFRQTDYAKPGESGRRIPGANYDGRLIVLSGIVKGDTLQEYETNRQSIITACRINKDGDGFPELTRLSFTTSAGNRYFVDAILRRPIIDLDDVRHAKFLLTALAPEPEIFGATAVSSGEITRQSGSGFIWPFTWPWTWGTSSGGSTTAVNGGNMETYPIITITGSSTSPYIYSSELDRYFQLNYTLTASDVLEIDMKEKSVILNGTTDMLVYVADGSQWFWLEPGSNPISYSTGSSSDTGTMSVDWYNAFLGV